MQVPLLNLDRTYRSWAGMDDDGTNFSAGGHFTKPMHRWVADNLSDFLTPLIENSAPEKQAPTQSSATNQTSPK
jgi:hypothetical protein